MSDFKITECKPDPCPFCGEEITLTDDHHGDYWEHMPKQRCPAGVFQILDESDFKAWQQRSQIKDYKALVNRIELTVKSSSFHTPFITSVTKLIQNFKSNEDES